jgi:DNA polymerase III alpha subunit (gram-positive type)
MGNIMHKINLLLLGLLLSCQSNSNLDLNKMESSGPIPAPSEAPEDWLLAHIDLETTGLLPGFHEMIDIGLVYTDLDGQILDSLFLRIQPEHPERLSEGAFNVNAFDPQKWEDLGALSQTSALDSLFSFHNKTANKKHVMLIAYNSHFDSAFLDHLFRSANKTWRELYHYYILDIPSMAWALGYRDLTGSALMEKFGIKDEPHISHLHTGITGAMKNVRIYKALIQNK